MKTVLVLAVVVGLAVAGHIPIYHRDISNTKFQNVDAVTAQHQYQVLEFFENIKQVNTAAGYYKIGQEYNIKANVQNYQKPEVVSTFFSYYEQDDFMPTYEIFSIFNYNMRQQAEALYDLFYYAKDFDTFYKTAAWARVHVNWSMFSYAFYVAVIQRADTSGLILPPYYEVAPDFYVNIDTINKIYYGKARGEPFEEFPDYGVYKEGNNHYYYQNYSSYFTYGDEYKLAYFTEDIGWNTFYAYFHVIMPLWQEGDQIAHGIFKERRGEIYYHFYQQLLARYYLERLSNDMGEIPTFSWNKPFEQGYHPFMTTVFTPFAQRSDNYVMQNEYNYKDLQFVKNYENMFVQFLEQGQVNAFNKQVDFANSKSINFVGNYWQCNPDLYENLSSHRNHHNSYEMAARRILGGAPINYQYGEGYLYPPTALDYYQTSARDPAFYQLYNKIFDFMSQYKQYLQPYTQNDLHYVGVKVNNVQVSNLETYFDFYSFNVSNMVFFKNQEVVSGTDQQYAVVQPRLNHVPFTVKISVKSDVEEQATFKVFIGPKYDSYGVEINIQDNYMNFVELDWFSQKLTKGENVIVRNSNDFFFYKDDSMSIGEIYNYLGEGKLPYDMIYNYDNLPERLMLPRGTNSGFPLQIFVAVYKSQGLPKELNNEHTFFLDERPLGYPFDRPVSKHFMQPNMYVQDVVVHHRGSEYPTSYEVVEQYVTVSQH